MRGSVPNREEEHEEAVHDERRAEHEAEPRNLHCDKKARTRHRTETRRRAKGGDYLKSEARKGESQAGAKGVEDRERASEPVDANLWERKRESKPANKLMAT